MSKPINEKSYHPARQGGSSATLLIIATFLTLNLFILSLLQGEKRLHTLINIYNDSRDGDSAVNLMLGSSTMRRLNPAWLSSCGQYSNRGIGRAGVDTIENYLNMPFKQWSARSILIYAGDNDVARDGLSFEETNARYKNMLNRLLAEYPLASLLLIEIKPSPKRAQHHNTYQMLNSELQSFANSTERVNFVSIGWQEKMTTSATIFEADGVHLNQNGYKIMVKTIATLCKKL